MKRANNNGMLAWNNFVYRLQTCKYATILQFLYTKEIEDHERIRILNKYDTHAWIFTCH